MIKVEIKKYNEIFNEYSSEDLNDNLGNYIYDEAKRLPVKKLRIKIKGKFTEEEQDVIIKLIHSHFREKTDRFTLTDRYDYTFKLVFLLLGIILLNLSTQTTSVLSEFVLIAGTVAVWEVVYDLLFGMMKRKRQRVICKKLSRCGIQFEE